MILAVLSHRQGNYNQLVITFSMVVRARDSSGIMLEWALLNACAGLYNKVMGLLLLPERPACAPNTTKQPLSDLTYINSIHSHWSY